jgi:drug/metabolite transporter (DMT)-like permease
MLGVALTLLSATTFGLNNVLVRRGVITGTAMQALVLSMPVGLASFALVALLFGQLHEVARFTPFALLMLACAGLSHFVFGRYCAYRALAAMGSNLSMPVTQWSLMVSLTLAIVFLGEKLDLMKLIGIALLILGPMALVARQRMRRAPAPASFSSSPSSFKPRLVEGYTFAILACFGWGSSPAFVRAGLEGPGHALAGGVVSYAAATLAIALLLFFPRVRRNLLSMTPKELRWFSGTSVMTSVSQILLYLATAVAPVVVVQPLMRFQLIVAAIGSWFINRQHEAFDAGVLGALLISMVGAMFLGIDGPAVVAWLDGPEWMVAAFGWSWP